MLLPLPLADVRRLSLKAHMDLFNLRNGLGNFDVTGELLMTVYVSYLLAIEDGRRDVISDLVSAEVSLRSLIKTVGDEGEWRLEADQCEAVERVLSLHDDQLASLPRHVYDGARARLLKMVNRHMLPTISEIESGSGVART